MSTIISPPNFDDLEALSAPRNTPQNTIYAPQENPAKAFRMEFEALRREVVINRELYRRSAQLSKGELHEQVEALRAELFEPKTTDNQAILNQVAQMIEAHTQKLIPHIEETIVQVVQHAQRMQSAKTEHDQEQPQEPTPQPTGPIEVPDTPSIQAPMSSRDRPERPQKHKK